MRGHIKQRSKGSWSIVIYLGKNNKTNKKKQKWYTYKGTKTDAEKFLTQKLRELDTNTMVNDNNFTVEKYLNYWYEIHCIENQSPTTYESYRRNIDKHIVPFLGNIKLSELQPLNLQEFYKCCGKKGLSNKTILYLHRILHSALNQAMKLQLVSRNVADNVEPPKPKIYKSTVLDTAQVSQLIQAIENTDINIPVIIAISTGMRRGEILGLAWDNVNLEQKYIVVCQALYPTKKGLLLLPPKTDKSNRKISIPDTLVNILLTHKTEQEKHKSLLKNNYNNKDFVCCKENGEPINPSILNHKFANILKINNLPKIRFHDLRHSHASLLLSKGVPSKLISERLGHSNVAITNDLYSHIYDADKQEVANIFDSFIK